MECLETPVSPVSLLILVILAGMYELGEASSHLLQTSHFTGYTGRGHIRVRYNPIDKYEEINSGRITPETSTPTTLRYSGPDLEESNDKNRRSRRDVNLPDGVVFDTFDNYIPFGNRGPRPVATFTDSNFDFETGYYTAPYSGTFFFLFHGPVGNELLVAVDLGTTDSKEGIRTSNANMIVSHGTSGVLPVILTLNAGDTVDISFISNRIRARFSAIFSAFDLQRKCTCFLIWPNVMNGSFG